MGRPYSHVRAVGEGEVQEEEGLPPIDHEAAAEQLFTDPDLGQGEILLVNGLDGVLGRQDLDLDLAIENPLEVEVLRFCHRAYRREQSLRSPRENEHYLLSRSTHQIDDLVEGVLLPPHHPYLRHLPDLLLLEQRLEILDYGVPVLVELGFETELH